ncbi:hypothetical protein QEJ31_09415 [Pigmentibacter sp. JX0631]|uniref:hypothetical protein n=1 Tax=Pigmentibacter sp. JX0631 TaxID=2976982 RepID=UPI0024696AFA|nr:hypothetical protein [Pigmentibacter sp. JX0631]WGL58742.1 hypothetical protein QEJ31_09415 [Pigmentibacter sp. JX0631]
MIFQSKQKIVIASLLIFPSHSIYAQSETDTTNLGEITFFPKEGDLYNETNIQFLNSNADGSNNYANQSNSQNWKSSATTYKHQSHFSFAKNHTLGLLLAYSAIESDTKSTQYSNISNQIYISKKSYKWKGLQNPLFIYQTRLHEQLNNDSYNLDFNAEFSPNIFPAKSASTNSDGTVASGNNLFNIGLNLSKKMQNSNFIKSGISLNYYTETNYESSSSDNNSTKVDPYVSGSIFLQGQKFFNPKLAISLKGEFYYVAKKTYNYYYNGNSNGYSKTDPAYSVDGQLRIDYIAIENSFTLFSSFNYGYEFENKSYSSNGSASNNKNMYSTAIALGTTYLL